MCATALSRVQFLTQSWSSVTVLQTIAIPAANNLFPPVLKLGSQLETQEKGGKTPSCLVLQSQGRRAPAQADPGGSRKELPPNWGAGHG